MGSPDSSERLGVHVSSSSAGDRSGVAVGLGEDDADGLATVPFVWEGVTIAGVTGAVGAAEKAAGATDVAVGVPGSGPGDMQLQTNAQIPAPSTPFIPRNMLEL